MIVRKLSAALATVVLGLTLSHAQQTRDPNGQAPVSQTQDASSDHVWGWIGLLGLLGLAGLLGRKKDTTQMGNKRDERAGDIRRVA